MKHKEMTSEWELNCIGKPSCEFNIIKFVSPPADSDIEGAECQSAFARAYIQHFCLFTEEQLKDNNLRGILDAAIFVIILALYHSILRFYKNTELLKFKVWDFRTVKANNYTIQINISRQMWLNFSRYIVNEMLFDDRLRRKYKIDFNQDDFDSYKHLINKMFEDELEKEIYKELNNLSSGKEEIGKIAFIQFAFRNSPLIKLLMQRGSIITNSGKLGKNLEDIDSRIDQLLA